MEARSKWTTICAALAVVVLTVVGCGGDDDSASIDSTFAKQADNVCNRAWEDGLAKGATYESNHSSDGVPKETLSKRAIKVAVLTAIEGEIDALRSLGAPEGDEEELEAMVVSLEKGYKKAKAWPANLSLTEVGNRIRASKQLQSYGITRCRS